MKNLNKWGFEIEERNEIYTKYRSNGAGEKNFMYLYKIFEGIYIYDIYLNESYLVKDVKTMYKVGYRIAYCKEGTYTSKINEGRIFIGTGEVFIGKSLPNTDEAKTLIGKSRAFNVTILPHEIKRNEYDRDTFNISEIVRCFLENLEKLKVLGFSTSDSNLVECSEQIIELLEKGDINYIRLKVLEMMYLITNVNLKKQQKEYVKYEDNFIQKTKEIEKYIKKNYQSKIIVTDLCQKFKISKNSLNNCFKTLFQYSPHEYLVKIRILKAQDLLITTDLNITNIASKVGFDNSSNFTRVFKKYCLVSPTRYRDQQNKS